MKKIIFVIIIITLYFFYSKYTKYKPTLVIPDELNIKQNTILNNQLKTFEKELQQYYDLDDKDKFKIDHGITYLDFFYRIGKPNLQIIYDKNEIIATGFAIVRKTPKYSKVFYICDTKIKKQYRGEHLPFQMLANSNELTNISNKAYAVSMNGKEENKIVRLINNINWIIDFKYSGNLLIYKVNGKVMSQVKIIIEKYKGPLYYVKLTNTKDLILKSNNEKIDLWHVNLIKNLDYVNYYKKDIITSNISDNSTYMFCFHELDPIIVELKNNNITTNISASIIQCNMNKLTPEDYDFIQTSEI
jgi:hypothetical protein